MNILITGASGFVGKHLVKELLNSPHQVETYNRQKGYSYRADLNDKPYLAKATKNKDLVIHLAASYKKNLNKINITGTKSLVEACVKNKVKKIIYMSSYDVLIKSKYGLSKLAAEKIIKNSGINYIILRPTVIYGGDNKNIGTIEACIKKYSIVPVPGDGTVKMQPLFVGDLVKLIFNSLKSEVKNQVYYVAGQVLSFNEMVDIIAEHQNKKAFKIHTPKFIVKLINKSLLNSKLCDIDDLKNTNKDLGFTFRNFRDGIASKKW